MSKPASFSDQPNQFSGICPLCGEVYQAFSRTDDLEGITFACRKVGCGGRVALAFSKPASNIAIPTKASRKSPPQGSPRLC